MPLSHKVTLIAPSQVSQGEAGQFPFDFFSRRCLAHGDSWFSIGSIPPGRTTNVLAELELTESTVIVNCAQPGSQLQHMTDTTTAVAFIRLLAGRMAMKWDAILMSGGGNDLIDAAGVGPAAPPDKRLLATAAERGAGVFSGDGYISEPGWNTFAAHLGAVFNALIDRRDSGINRHVPLVLHTYAHLMPRPAPAGPGFGPWLAPALTAFAVPAADWLGVSNALVDRLALLLEKLAGARRATDPECALYVVDSRTAQLVLAEQTATASSGDFLNEIHPTRGGYNKLAEIWRQTLDQLL
jgi:hypothetical protein